MDCYFHSNVPSVAPCIECGKAICTTCRDERGGCPSCRLAARVEAATATRPKIAGTIPPRPAPATVHGKVTVATAPDPVESRALVALGYPLWPLALISLLDRKQSRKLRRQAFSALGFNLGMYALWGLLSLIAQVPFVNISAWVILPLLAPLFLVASVYYGIKTWNGEDVRIPVVSSWVDERLPADEID
ncbi:MAG: DUF4870 domain-containing protein [Candidatus Eremiobacteraeota bacterium]|nr:DUF4870 domain-containing protein [Candidatus Eremiobacteraeota bacterium]MBV9264342.1 DUF4870 domain-containing protein [Candidatus Eremiobacteraeota bacterium]